MSTQPEEASLGSTLNALRRAAGLTQGDVAAQLGVGRSAYAYYETGGSVPNLKTLGKLATIFGVTTDYLLGRPEYKADRLSVQDAMAADEQSAYAQSRLLPNEQAMLTWFRQLSETEQEELIRQLSGYCLGNDENRLQFLK